MTVSTEISSNEYTGNGVTTDFDYKFRIFKANQLSVITSDADGDNVVTLRLGTDYTVTGANKSTGGKVILTKPLADKHKISIARDIPITQETSFRNQSKFFAETHEDAFDYLTMIIQRIWGSLGSLYLKRPNILANWFDAKGYRIANLGKPKRDSDAVDLGTLKDEISGVNSTILKREKRLLRVDDMDIAAFPKATERRNKQIGFDKSGSPTLLDPVETGALGYVLVDSFEEGALITSRYQALHFNSQGEFYRWDGDLLKAVPAGSTPQSTGGVGKGAWVSVGDASLRSDLKNGDGSLIGVGSGTLKDLIESMQYIDFNSFSLGRDDKSQAFIEFIEKCNLENKKAVGDISDVVISTPIKINNSFEFSGIVTFTGDGSITCINEIYEVLNVDKAGLTESATIIPEFDNLTGMIIINSKSRLMKRAGLDEIVHYGEVNYVENGVLRHPLNDNYSDKLDVEVRFLKKEDRAKKACKISARVIDNNGHIIIFKGSNFDADTELVDVIGSGIYSNFVRFEYCHSFSHTLTVHKSMGTPTHTAYDTYIHGCYGITLNTPTSPLDSGWKTIDGTHFRNLTVNGGSIYALHSHWNGSDVFINNSFAAKSYQFASHINDGMYDINAVVTNDNTFVGCRADYGFLAGSLNLSGKLLHNKQNSGAIYRHVTDLHVDPDNVGVVFKMPKHVHMNIALLGGRVGEEVSLIETRNPDQTSSYIPWGKLSGSVDYSGFNGNPVLRVAMTTVSNHVFKVDLKQCLDNGSAMRLEIGKQDQSILMSDNVNVNITIRDSKVSCSSQTAGNRKILFARGELNVIGGEMVGLFSSINQYSVPVGGNINLESCIWRFDSVSEWAGTNLLAKYTTLSNVTFDGSNIEQLFTKAGFWVSTSHGCKAINLDLANDFAMYAPRSNAINASTKKMAPINPRGMLDNFDRDFVATKQ
ncbi:MAG: hypothetical protein ACQEWL_01945 [Pseudomonadota bacterium]